MTVTHVGCGEGFPNTMRVRNVPVDRNEVAKGCRVGRAGQAQDIANGVLFLPSDASSYMTGAELVIDGGMTGDVP